MVSILQTAINRLPLKGFEKSALEGALQTREDFIRLNCHYLEIFTERRLRVNNRNLNFHTIWCEAERECGLNEQQGIHVCHINEAVYPGLLREIYNPPYLLYYRGTLSDVPMTAIVGTRNPSSTGAAEAYALASEEIAFGRAVVSGLASGIDEAAHKGALVSGGITIAVLASGPDFIYPWENRKLADDILESGGALLSEYPAGVKPDRFRFPQRNRIVSGMCGQTILVEAPEKSGALITADFCLEQNRDLFLAAGSLDSSANAGGRKLYDEGAPLRFLRTPVVSDLGSMDSDNIVLLLKDELSGLNNFYKGSYIYNVY